VHDPRLQPIRDALDRRPGRRAAAAPGTPRASVALVLRPAPADLELLLIKRAERAGDPWSGHMALPGGRSDPGDADAEATAVRETLEEVGIDLAAEGVALGSLDDLAPRGGAPRIVVAPFVFGAPAGTVATPNHEVDAAIWIPLRELAHPDAATEFLLDTVTGEHQPPRSFPAIGTRGYVIWGMTHRILDDFLALALPPAEPGDAA
jgi:8-oxo-dGTP pyrophosphatase MutT (NUDIX family)